MKIVADDKIPFLKGALEPYSEVIYLPGKEIDNSAVLDADALLVRTRTKCNEKLLRNTDVRFIGTATIGYDHIDTSFCNSNNICWTNAPGCNSSSVRQYIASALLTISSENKFLLKDKIIGIVGVGNVGSKVEQFARAVGMKVLLNDPPRARNEGGSHFVRLERLLEEADIVTVHVPLTREGEDKTWHLFNGSTFRKMKKGAWFINSSRGEVTDSAALSAALERSALAGAILDVWENEPSIDRDLLAKVTIATPHIAGYSTDGKANGTAMVVNSLSAYFNIPLKTWYPADVPEPHEPVISVDGKGKTAEEIIREAVLHTYDVRTDDRKLRDQPDDFEKIRGDYPLRREFHSYSVKCVNVTAAVRDRLQQIGFRIV